MMIGIARFQLERAEVDGTIIFHGIYNCLLELFKERIERI